MPFYNDNDEIVTLQEPTPEVETPTASFGELFVGSLKNDTSFGMVGNYISNKIIEPSNDSDESFDPFAEDNIKGWEEYADNFINANNPAMMQHIKSKITREVAHQKSFEGTGISGIGAQLAAGVLDPINVIFSGTGSVVGGVARLGVKSKIAAGAIGTAVMGAGQSALYEGIAQTTKETRTAEESIANIGFATVLTGVLGGATSSIAARAATKDAALVNKIMTETADSVEKELDVFATVMSGQSTVGAAQVVKPTIEDITVKSAFGAEKAFAFLGPEPRLAQSPSKSAREAIMGMAESSLERMGAEKGIAQEVAVESLVRQWRAKNSQASVDLRKTFLEYRQKSGLGKNLVTDVQDLTGNTGGKLTFQQFKEEVGRAMIRGDKHENPFVAKMAQQYRTQVFEPLKQNAIKAGLLPENVDIKTAESYLHRVYDKPKIIAQRPDFVARISNYLKNSAVKSDDPVTRGLLPEDWDDIAEDITDTIVGLPSGGVPYDLSPVTRGPMKGRTLLIPDVDIEDFLERDISKISNIYTSKMGTDSELALKFGKTTLEDQIAAIKDDYKTLRAAAGDDAKALKKLQKREEADIRDLAGVRDRLRGIYGMPNNPNNMAYRGVRLIKNINYLRLLGGMTISSITDVARPVMRNGLLKSFKGGFVPLVKNWKAVKMTAEENRLAGAAWDLLDSSTAKSIWDIVEQHSAQTKFERGVEWMTDKFGAITLMNHWNTAMKHYAGNVIQHTINDTILNYGKASPKFTKRLATLGIGKDNIRPISAQLKKYGVDMDGVFVANTSAWDDIDAVRAYRAALSKEINIEIVSPGQEKSLWMSGAHYGFLGQFKSFAVSSVQRTLLTGLQDRDLAALNGLTMSLALGAGVYYLKTPEDRLSDDPVVWATEAVDRSGMTGVIFDLNNMAEKATGGRVGMSRITGETASRYASRDLSGAFLGPSLDAMSQGARVVGSAATGQFTQSDLHAVRRMIPMQNLFYARWLFDQAEEATIDTFDIPKKAKNK